MGRAAYAERRNASKGDATLRVFYRGHIRDHDAVRAEIEHALEYGGLDGGHTDNARHRIGMNRLQLVQQVGELGCAVFEIEQQPIIAGSSRDLGSDW